ncbi:uncharacterized protein EV420DRAFT_1549670 [Desarmillaria tabescens]|uniref:Uncharacterized protein n=1 Tax=Armillaria tabescens TaxID=1929756 RepID=A0AA39KAG8_ARMTA|nr:uncharacterized protein EV420DRAFT_1549670 [Desarmillaria tabescens]KAK0457253.1 hypothetical protein EV420DRAFT_1549670 [Desarmillaria tabescens]
MPPSKLETVFTYLDSMISPAWLSTLLLVVFLSQSAFPRISIPPLKPSTAVQHLATSINEATSFFNAHTRELGTFNIKLLLLGRKSQALSRELCEANKALLWFDRSTWLRYIFRMKKIWNDTRDHQRKVDALRKCMQNTIFTIEEERLRVEAEIAQIRESAAGV